MKNFKIISTICLLLSTVFAFAQKDMLAVRRGNVILMNYNFDGRHDLQQTYGHGNGEDEYLTGNWNKGKISKLNAKY
ncbi:MAG: hypothetical protein H6559_29995 [Lewinellaceae bacterium]|nr:hypothetical protein [Lewinellaceae bacterium]